MFFLLVIFLPHFTCVWVIVQCFLAVFSLLLLFLLLFLFLRLLSGCGVFHCKNDSSILLAEKRFANALFNTSCHGIIHNSVFFCALTKLLWFSFFVFLLAFILYLNRTRSVSFVLSIGWFFFHDYSMLWRNNIMLCYYLHVLRVPYVISFLVVLTTWRGPLVSLAAYCTA